MTFQILVTFNNGVQEGLNLYFRVEPSLEEVRTLVEHSIVGAPCLKWDVQEIDHSAWKADEWRLYS